jgi:hypothetical protein
MVYSLSFALFKFLIYFYFIALELYLDFPSIRVLIPLIVYKEFA